VLITDIGESLRRRAPISGGPTAVMLTPGGTSGQLAAIHMGIPPGGGMPEHDHGPSEILLIPLNGSAEIRHGGQVRALPPGTAAHIARGERVSLANPGPRACHAHGRRLTAGLRQPPGIVASRVTGHRPGPPAPPGRRDAR
jgi:quercetin dioxygenase-like cupin family protein